MQLPTLARENKNRHMQREASVFHQSIRLIYSHTCKRDFSRSWKCVPASSGDAHVCLSGAHSATLKAFNPLRGLNQQHSCQWNWRILAYGRGWMVRVKLHEICIVVMQVLQWWSACLVGLLCRSVCSFFCSCINNYAYYLLYLLPPPTGTHIRSVTAATDVAASVSA